MNWPNRPEPQSIMGIMGYLMVLILSGCATKKHDDKIFMDGYHAAIERSIQFMTRYDCKDAKWLADSEIALWEMKQ